MPRILLTLHHVAEGKTLAACTVCHQINRSLAAGHAHLEEAHPRRYALAKERNVQGS